MRDRFRLLPTHTPGIDAVSADSGRHFSRHTHDQFGIGVMVSGAQQSASGIGVVEAQAGDVITVNPGEVHDGIPLGTVSRSWKMLYFNPDMIWQAGSDITEGKTTQFELLHPVARDAGLMRDVLNLFASHTGAIENPLRGEELLLTVLAHLGEAKERNTLVDPSVRVVLERMDDDPARPVSLAQLANLSGLSRFQILRAVARQTGLTPHSYVMQRRLHLARRLIRKGRSLAETAVEAGFADQSHMTRLFVKTYGMTPGRYSCLSH